MSTRILYGTILLDQVKTVDYVKEPVLDGPTLTTVKYTVRGTGVFNPALNAYTQTGLNPPQARPGNFAPLTEQALWWKLSQPRQRFVYNVGGTLGNLVAGNPTINGGVNLIVSPALGPPAATVDAANGPFVTVHKIEEIWGQRTFRVSFTVTTFVSGVNQEVATPSALLSHRWRSSEVVDIDGFSSLQVQGRAIFRTDRLEQLGAKPDDFREFLFHAPQPGFRRGQITAVANEDGNVLEYAFTDQRLAPTLDPRLISQSNVTRIEAYNTRITNRQGLEANIGGIVRREANAAGAAFGAAQGGPLGVLANLPNLVAQGGGPFNFLRAAVNLVPRREQVIVVRVWGNPRSSRFILFTVADTIIRLKTNFALKLLGDEGVVATEDLAGKFVEMRLHLVGGPAATLLDAAGQFLNPLIGAAFGVAAGGGNAVFNLAAQQNDGIAGVFVDRADAMPLNFGRRSRGDYTAGLAAQALLAASDASPAPAFPANPVNNRTP